MHFMQPIQFGKTFAWDSGLCKVKKMYCLFLFAGVGMFPCSLDVLFISLHSPEKLLELNLAIMIYDPEPKEEFETDSPVCIHSSI